VIVDFGEAPEAFAPRLRQVVAETDPAAMVESVGVLDEPDLEARIGIWSLIGLGGLALIAIVLSSAALYALMSFTVARRTREIGIRTALGGSAPRIVATIARRALVQIGVGVGTGAVFWVLVLRLATGGWGTGTSGSGDLAASTAHWPLVLLLTAGAVLAVGLPACAVPTLKGIRIRPLDALRAE
jgi:ABC-type antimicrobial peptide transport system permease subunit